VSFTTIKRCAVAGCVLLVAVGVAGCGESAGHSRAGTAASSSQASPAGEGSRAAELYGLLEVPDAFRAADRGPSVVSVTGDETTGMTLQYAAVLSVRTTFTVLRHQGGPMVAVGSFAHIDQGSQNELRFTGRLSGHKLKPGSYQLRAVAESADGKKGAPVTRDFRVIP